MAAISITKEVIPQDQFKTSNNETRGRAPKDTHKK